MLFSALSPIVAVPTGGGGGGDGYKMECAERQFRCDTGDCIAISYVCDKEPDCPDGSDEHPDRCNNNGRCK